MGYLALAILYPVWFTAFMWLLFIVGVTLQKRHKHRFSEPIFEILKSLFLTVDVLYNILVGSLIFLEYPKVGEKIFSDRVIRHKHFGKGWRKTVAMFVCRNFLEPFDCEHCA